MYKRFHVLSQKNAWRVSCLCSFILLVVACHKETKAERYAREAKETTAQCPMAIDANTTMDSMTYTLDTHRFTYYYTLNGISDSLLLANEELFRQQIHERLLNSTDLLPYIQDHMSFRYVYRTATSSTPLMDFVYEN